MDGIRLDGYVTGREYEVGNTIGALFLAEGWAEPVPLDAPAPYVPFSRGDPFTLPIISREQPHLTRDGPPPHLELLHTAADVQRRRRRRRR